VIAKILRGVLALDRSGNRSENTAASNEARSINKLQDETRDMRLDLEIGLICACNEPQTDMWPLTKLAADHNLCGPNPPSYILVGILGAQRPKVCVIGLDPHRRTVSAPTRKIEVSHFPSFWRKRSPGAFLCPSEDRAPRLFGSGSEVAAVKLSRNPQDFDVADGAGHSRCERSESF
jgi:hypothetical protein